KEGSCTPDSFLKASQPAAHADYLSSETVLQSLLADEKADREIVESQLRKTLLNYEIYFSGALDGVRTEFGKILEISDANASMTAAAIARFEHLASSLKSLESNGEDVRKSLVGAAQS